MPAKYHNMAKMLNINLCNLPSTLSFILATGGVQLNRSQIKIDSQGYVDKITGERY